MDKVIIEKVVVNNEIFYTGEFFDEFRVYPPSNKKPYWEIKFLQNGKTVKLIKATGMISYSVEYKEEVK